jgi:hypothetical protein
MDDFTVTIADVRQTGHCVRGIRRWAELQGLDFADFIKHGIPASRLLATGDGMAASIVEKVRALHV